MFKSGYFISIGAGKNQLPLILKLKELGLKVIAVDKSIGAPGFLHSDIRLIESILDYRRIYYSLLRLFLDEPIVGIGVRSYGKSVITASYLGDKLGLIGTSHKTLKKFYNKKTMKFFLGEKGILVPNSYSWQYVREIPSLIQQISYPCILKPVASIAKIGIEVFHNPITLQQRLTQLKSKNDQFLLEEFIVGQEITVIGFVQNGKFILISISDKITTTYPPFIELSHRLPMSQEKVKGEVKLIIQNISQLTELENSPIVAEFKITPRGEIYLIEIMPEIGGEFIADFLIPEFYSYDYFKNYIFLQTGKNISQVNAKKKKRKTIQSQICFIAPPEGKSKFISNKNQKIEFGKKTFLNSQLKEIGVDLNTSEGNSCRVHVFGVSADMSSLPEDIDAKIRKTYDAKFE